MFAQVEFGLCDEKECISIILDNEEQVNEFMLMLIEKSFIVNCEPRYLGAFYEGSVWCGDEHYLSCEFCTFTISEISYRLQYFTWKHCYDINILFLYTAFGRFVLCQVRGQNWI